MKKEQKLAPREETCLMIVIAQNHPSGPFRVPNVNTGEIAIRQNVSWPPGTPEVREGNEQAAASGGGQ